MCVLDAEGDIPPNELGGAAELADCGGPGSSLSGVNAWLFGGLAELSDRSGGSLFSLSSPGRESLNDGWLRGGYVGCGRGT